MKSVLLWAVTAFALSAQSLTGLWDATVLSRGVTIPFRMEFASDGTRVQAWFFNGGDRSASTSGTFQKGTLRVQFAQLATRLEATYKDGRLDGTYFGDRVSGNLRFHAERAVETPKAESGNAPLIGGEWELQNISSGKREKAWRFLVQQSGAEVTATILRVDGDTGALTGRWQNGKFVLSHFSGQRPALLEIEARADGTLHLSMNGGRNEYTAVRPQQARAQGLAAPCIVQRLASVPAVANHIKTSVPLRRQAHLEGNLRG
jgi:hypothetical protein